MNEYANLLYKNEDGVGVVVINRPRVFNALNREVLAELGALFDRIARSDEIKVVVITGAGDKAFAAGADIAEMRSLSVMEGRALSKAGQRVFGKLEKLPQPVIAVVNGFALGGGCELAIACDIRIASEKAKFSQPEVALGIIPGYGGTQRLPRLIGHGRAKEMIFSGDMIDAEEAYRIGLVNKVVPVGEAMDVAMGLARKIMSRAAIAVQLSKAAINEGADMDLESGVAHEADVFGLCFATADQKEGMVAFLEKRAPAFKC